MIIWLLFLVLVVAAVVWLVRSIPHASNGQARLERRSPGLEVLEERYAKGEIQRDEYLQKKRDLGG
jgi:putative membrane protein